MTPHSVAFVLRTLPFVERVALLRLVRRGLAPRGVFGAGRTWVRRFVSVGIVEAFLREGGEEFAK